MIGKILGVIVVMLLTALFVAVCAMFLVLHDYEHEKAKCGNCACRDAQMKYCWSRGFHVGTEDKACSLFQNKDQV